MTVKHDFDTPTLGIGLLFYLIFCYYLPQTLVIGDEIAYLHQAVALVDGHSMLYWPSPQSGGVAPMIAFQYPLGNALFISFFIAIFGLKYAFLAGGTALFLSFLVLMRTLRDGQYPVYAALLVFIFPVNSLLGHTLMSDIPALLHSSLFMALYMKPQRRAWQDIVLGLLGGSTLLWRETHFLVCFFPLLGLILRGGLSERLRLGVGWSFGIGLRFGLTKAVYGSFFYIKEPSPFGWVYVWQNLPLIALIFVIFIPDSLRVWGRFQHRDRWYWHIGIGLYLAVFAFYGYNGLTESGFLKATVLFARFFVPTLPFFVLFWGQHLSLQSKQRQKRYKQVAFIVSLAAVLGSQMVYNRYVQPHRQLQDWVYSLAADKVHFADYECLKVLNAGRGARSYCPTDSLEQPEIVARALANAPFFYVHTWSRWDTEYGSDIERHRQQNRRKVLAAYRIDTLFRLKTRDNIEFQTLKIIK